MAKTRGANLGVSHFSGVNRWVVDYMLHHVAHRLDYLYSFIFGNELGATTWNFQNDIFVTLRDLGKIFQASRSCHILYVNGRTISADFGLTIADVWNFIVGNGSLIDGVSGLGCGLLGIHAKLLIYHHNIFSLVLWAVQGLLVSFDQIKL